MFYIESSSTNPYFNIATEEYLLRETTEEFLILYIDDPSVIIGKHQNAIAEINYRYVSENNIPVVRRISGGGAVYHDSGNLNFCFIANSREGSQIDFKKYTSPIIESLIKDYGIPAQLEGKNDIRVQGLKVSGNAEHVFKNRVLHHGTLLINSDLKKLSEALRVVSGRYTDNAVKSIRSKVSNLSTFNPIIEINNLKEKISKRVSTASSFESYSLSIQDRDLIQKRVDEKFQRWEWNYGYSPSYIFHSEGIELKIENGIIVAASIPTSKELEKSFIGKEHSEVSLKAVTEEVWRFF